MATSTSGQVPKIASLVLMLAVGIGVGWMMPKVADRGTDEDAPGPHGPSRGAADRRIRRANGAESATYGKLPALRAELRKAPKERMAGIVLRILQVADSVERQALLMEAFAGADADTCMEIMDQFGKVTRETGRIQHGDWTTGLFLAGRAGGAELLDKYVGVHGAGNTQFQEGIRGFAARDPQAALAWLDAQDESLLPGKEQLLPRLMAGAAMGDPETAVRMMNELKPGQQSACLEWFTSNLIQSAGLDRTTDWLLDTMKTPAPDDDPGRDARLEAQMFRRVFEAAEWSGGEREMAERLVHIDSARPIAPERLTTVLGRLHGTSALAVAEYLAKTPLMQDIDQAASVIATAVAVASPHRTEAWLEKHPNSPIRTDVERVINGTGK